MQQPPPRRGIAVPAIRPKANLARPGLLPQLRHQLSLGKDIPGRIGPLEGLQQPSLLLVAQQSAGFVNPLAATGGSDVTAAPRWHLAGLLGAVLSAIEDGKGHELAVPHLAVEPHALLFGDGPRAERHVDRKSTR